MYKALVVDDHPFIRATVRVVLAQVQVEVVAEADNGVDAVQLARALAPDLILVDISIPRLDGLNVIQRLTLLPRPSRIVVLTSQSSHIYMQRCRRIGAHGFVCKGAELDDLAMAADIVLAGGSYFPQLDSGLEAEPRREGDEMALVQKLSNREIIVLQHLARGRTNAEIAEEMIISTKTVSTYKARILQKLAFTSVVHLAEFAKRNQLI